MLSAILGAVRIDPVSEDSDDRPQPPGAFGRRGRERELLVGRASLRIADRHAGVADDRDVVVVDPPRTPRLEGVGEGRDESAGVSQPQLHGPFTDPHRGSQLGAHLAQREVVAIPAPLAATLGGAEDHEIYGLREELGLLSLQRGDLRTNADDVVDQLVEGTPRSGSGVAGYVPHRCSCESRRRDRAGHVARAVLVTDYRT